MDNKTQGAWMKIIKPVAAGLVTLMAAATLYLQRQDSGTIDSRVTAIEVRQDAQDRRMDASDKRGDRFDSDINSFKLILGDIRSDVAYVRGKMEAMK